VRLWARTQRVSDDTMDLLLGYLSQTNGRLWTGPLAPTFCPAGVAGMVTSVGSCSSSI
jgi:hypothetical protein